MNGQVKLAIPTDAPGGLEARCSAHFGHSDGYTLVTLEDDDQIEVDIIPNNHGAGCGSVVDLLVNAGANVVMVKGIGSRPLMVFQRMGIEVRKGAGARARDVVASYRSGRTIAVDDRQTCQASGRHRHNRPRQGNGQGSRCRNY